MKLTENLVQLVVFLVIGAVVGWAFSESLSPPLVKGVTSAWAAFTVLWFFFCFAFMPRGVFPNAAVFLLGALVAFLVSAVDELGYPRVYLVGVGGVGVGIVLLFVRPAVDWFLRRLLR